jgi:hypothetical protein
MGLQNAFMSGFLKFGEKVADQKALISFFERWMGFVHSAGYGRLFNEGVIKSAVLSVNLCMIAYFSVIIVGCREINRK